MVQSEAATIKNPRRFHMKVAKLILENRLFQLCPTIYIVVGNHGVYRVAFENGEWHCNCPGFQQSDVCSHVEAVDLVDRLRKAFLKPLTESL